MSGLKKGTSLTSIKLRGLHEYLNLLSLKDRVHALGLNPDRADVVIPAGEICLTLLK